MDGLRKSHAGSQVNPRGARPDLAEVGAPMLAFGLGPALPLAALGLLSRDAVLRWRTRLMTGGAQAKGGICDRPCDHRCPRTYRARQARRDFASRSVAAMAHRPRDAVLRL